MGIYSKLMAIQTELKAPKDRFNNFGKYKYRSAETILEMVKPLAQKNNALCVLDDCIQHVGDRYYVEATATLIDCENGEKTSVKAYAREQDEKKGMDGSQITGMASSYARKYALGGLFAIDDGRDSDALNKGDDAKDTDTPDDAMFGKPGAPNTCERCGAVISETTGRSGETITAEQVIKLSEKFFGGAHYCTDCQKVLKGKKK